MRVIELEKKADWTKAFKAEATLIKKMLGNIALTIHHIGSTAIPGIYAKPIIDIILEVDRIDILDSLDEQFKTMGYEVKGQFGIPGRRFFQKGGDERTHHIHAFACDDPTFLRHIHFRDYLIAHPEKAKAYESLKLSLAQRYKNSPEKYSEGKSELIKVLEQEAFQWVEKNHRFGVSEKKIYPKKYF